MHKVSTHSQILGMYPTFPSHFTSGHAICGTELVPVPPFPVLLGAGFRSISSLFYAFDTAFHPTFMVLVLESWLGIEGWRGGQLRGEMGGEMVVQMS